MNTPTTQQPTREQLIAILTNNIKPLPDGSGYIVHGAIDELERLFSVQPSIQPTDSTEWKKALVSLTPGGSEYADDPARCVEWVKEWAVMAHDQMAAAIKEKKALQSELSRLRAEAPRFSDLIYEQDLPEMNDEEYTAWYRQSHIVDGVRMGPKLAATPPTNK